MAITNFVDSLIARLGAGSHEQLLGAVTDALREHDWDVETEPRVGRMRPDLIAHDGAGTNYVIELKATPPPAFVGAVAQVEAQLDGYRRDRGEDALGVLMFAGEAPTDLAAVARDAGIELLPLTSLSPASIADSLSRLAADSKRVAASDGTNGSAGVAST